MEINKKLDLNDKMVSLLWNNLMLCCEHDRTFCAACCNDQKCLICNKIVGKGCNCSYIDFVSSLTLEKYEEYMLRISLKNTNFLEEIMIRLE